MNWKHFYICESLPGNSWGTGGIGLGDFDGDGDLDVAISRRETQTAYWFERRDDSTWVKHVIASSEYLSQGLGAVALDVDHDERMDVVFGNVWFRNPGNLSENANAQWETCPLDMGSPFVHDIVAADINGDGFDDIVVYDGKTLSWFDTSNGLARTIITTGRNDHGGVAPCGVGDLNGNGHTDIVLPGVWFENPGGRGGDWKQHAWPHSPVPKASYGPSIRVWIADMNGDGRNDIVYSDCDTAHSHVYWVENMDRGEQWIVHKLPDPPGHPATGSFHSLGVADFNLDGLPEIFAGEQEDPNTSMEKDGLLPMKPSRLKERGVMWLNDGGSSPNFVPVVISEGRPGWHDAVLGDVNGDGLIEIVSKVWNADGPNYHLDYWRNEQKSG